MSDAIDRIVFWPRCTQSAHQSYEIQIAVHTFDQNSAMDASSPQEVGCRVQVVKDRATVRYIGNVRGQEGTWVGVEWDDVSRGKHDGTAGGVKYFECASGTNSGSFVRMEKVFFGYSLLEAVIAR